MVGKQLAVFRGSFHQRNLKRYSLVGRHVAPDCPLWIIQLSAASKHDFRAVLHTRP